ncbi:ferritin family protein [Nitrosomonas communis]
MHRAIISLREELQAIDLYNQRVDACKNSVSLPPAKSRR